MLFSRVYPFHLALRPHNSKRPFMHTGVVHLGNRPGFIFH
uniref:Uncharacterized protein n=1 Tax=Anguilla anguilla TaxID=7936 RepID=A0A0E9V7M0_ANGAN